MVRRNALCVGINQYKNFPSATLQGCVHDANDMAQLLKDVHGFTDPEITLLVDQNATKSSILRELKRMVNEARAGKINHLVFSLSCHGTQVPDLNLDEMDRADEAFCPYDLAQSGSNWNRDHLIVDDELHDLFTQLPSNVLLEVYLDTCHSGTGLKSIDLLLDRKPRYLPSPSLEGFRDMENRRARSQHVKMLEKGITHHILWTACKDNQTSADALIGGDWHGAFTYYLCKELRAGKNKLSRAKILSKVRADLAAGHFSQTPQLECEATVRHATHHEEALVT